MKDVLEGWFQAKFNVHKWLHMGKNNAFGMLKGYKGHNWEKGQFQLEIQKHDLIQGCFRTCWEKSFFN